MTDLIPVLPNLWDFHREEVVEEEDCRRMCLARVFLKPRALGYDCGHVMFLDTLSWEMQALVDEESYIAEVVMLCLVEGRSHDKADIDRKAGAIVGRTSEYVHHLAQTKSSFPVKA